MVSRIGLFIACVCSAVGLAGCGEPTDERPRVVAAFYPLAYVASELTGEPGRVLDLTPPGAEPHDVELGSSQVTAVRDAELVLYLGRGFQPGLEQVVAERDGPSLDLLSGQRLLSGDGRMADPHVWLDPTRLATMVTRVGTRLDAAGAAAGLAARLTELDREFRDGLADCRRREIVTSHAAFGYLADRYDLQQVALAGITPESEPSPADLAALVERIEAIGATTIFFETLVSPRLAETVAREVGVEAAVLNPVEGLTDAQATAGDDYFSLMRDNLTALRRALECGSLK